MTGQDAVRVEEFPDGWSLRTGNANEILYLRKDVPMSRELVGMIAEVINELVEVEYQHGFDAGYEEAEEEFHIREDSA